MKVFGFLIILCSFGANAQELFPHNEPASSIPKNVIGIRTFGDSYNENGTPEKFSCLAFDVRTYTPGIYDGYRHLLQSSLKIPSIQFNYAYAYFYWKYQLSNRILSQRIKISLPIQWRILLRKISFPDGRWKKHALPNGSIC